MEAPHTMEAYELSGIFLTSVALDSIRFGNEADSLGSRMHSIGNGRIVRALTPVDANLDITVRGATHSQTFDAIRLSATRT
jgi:hypothetical protein